jgi:HrpA-like RNA helicase/ElaB/YqjD/DUF883 family membrane-anchored ribosome-binding protein
MDRISSGVTIPHNLSEAIISSETSSQELRLAERILNSVAADIGLPSPSDAQIQMAAKIISNLSDEQIDDENAEWLLFEAIRLVEDSANKIRKVTKSKEDLSDGGLPVERYKDEIIETIRDNQVSIITAETGAGKSSMVPHYLLEEGYRVIVTQPRRMAARSLADWVSSQYKSDKPGTVAYRTAFERNDSRDTKLLYCTDGLQMVRELAGDGAPEGTVLVLDEIHEWNINMEVLIAWVKKQIDEGKNIKVVLMSATLDSQLLAEFFQGEGGQKVPQIEIPGRLYPVSENESSEHTLISTIETLVGRGRNVLVFQPGKKEIRKTIEELEKANLDAEIIPLHGQLEPRDQELAFRRYGRPKVVVSTNVAQTSVTIEDIDAVVDSGEERRMELVNQVEKLSLRPISQADCKQRKGRAGRCRPGEYYLCSRTALDERDEFPMPEIRRVRLDQMVLRLAAYGMDATEIEFFHQPDIGQIKQAKKALIAIGALRPDDSVTEIGEEISRLPIDVHKGRMIIEARKHNCVDEVLTIAACMEAGGIRDKTNNWRRLTQETYSDALAELDIFRSAREMKPDAMQTNGINVKSYFRALEIRKHLTEGLDDAKFKIEKSETIDREAIMRSVVSGMVDNLYEYAWGDYYRRNGDSRLKARQSVVLGAPKWLVGTPIDIDGKNRWGDVSTMPLLTMCSRVDLEWLFDVAPQLVENQVTEPYYSSSLEGSAIDKVTIFNGSEVRRDVINAPVNTNTVAIFCKEIILGRLRFGAAAGIYWHNQRIIGLLEREGIASAKEIDNIIQENLIDIVDQLIGLEINNNHDLEEAVQRGRIKVTDLAIQPEKYLSGKKLAMLKAKLEQLDKEVALEEFLRKNPPRRIFFDPIRSLPTLPNPMVYDYESGEMAYPCLIYDRGVCSYYWHPSSSYAVKETNDALLKIIIEAVGKHLSIANKTLDRLKSEFNDPDNQEFFNTCQATIDSFVGFLNSDKRFHEMDIERIDELIGEMEEFERSTIGRLHQDEISEGNPEAYVDQVRRGHILEHFEITCESEHHVKCGEAFVIMPDGTLRTPDQTCAFRRNSDAKIYWRAVKVDELAICWTNEKGFETIKKPLGGVTEDQLSTVAKLEDERYVSRGTFGVDRDDDQVNTLQKQMRVSLDDMDDDEILEHHELITQMIEQVLAENQDIDSIFNEMEKIAQRLSEIATDLERLINERDLATGNKAERLKHRVKELQTERKEMQMKLGDLKPRVIEQEKARDLLNALRQREQEIDIFFN